MGHKKKAHQRELETKTVSKGKKYNEPDLNIIKALKRLPKEMKNADGVLVFFRESKDGDYDTIQHIAAKRHGFKESDIEVFPVILLDPKAPEPRSDKEKHYVGDRPKPEKRIRYIRIVTEKKGDKEAIKTAFTSSKGRRKKRK